MTEPASGDHEPPSSRRLLNATAVMASGTMISRVLGFVRAMLVVFVLGNGTRQADTLSMALTVPNSLYMIFAGGALNTVLVPQIVRRIKQDADGGEAFVNRIMTAFLVILGAVTLICIAATPAIMWVWSGSTWQDPAMAPHWSKLVMMAYITMPQLFFYGAFFLVGQVLNARDKFGPMMWAPILNNLVAIAVLGVYVAVWGSSGDRSVPFTDAQVWVLGAGSTIGIIVQTLALIPAVRQIGFRYRPRWDWKGQGLGATFHLAKWMLGYVLLTQLAAMIVNRLASDATVAAVDGSGAGVATYANAYLVFILPHSLLTVSLATAMLPSASRLAASDDMAGVAAETGRTMRLALTFLLPASVALVVLAGPFAELFFGHGQGAKDAHLVALTLAGFAVGLVPYTIQYVYLRGYYALEDTKTPFYIQIVISGANALLAVVLVRLTNDPQLVAPSLAVAYSLSYLIGAVVTFRALKKRLPDLNGGKLMGHVVQLLIAVLPGALIAWAITYYFSGSSSKVIIGLGFVLAVIPAALLFFVIAKRLGVPEATQLISILRRRGRRAEPDALEVAEYAADAVGDDHPGGGVPPTSELYSEQSLLNYPDPDDGHSPVTAIPRGPDAVSEVRSGQILNARFRLDEVLARRDGTLTWRGTDLKLGRAVLVHVMAPGDPRTLEMLDLARASASATDERFLRVWELELVEGEPHGSWIVCEYVPGQSVELALHKGAFTPVEAAWVVKQVAEALASMHAQGLHHRRINPDTVIITASGNVKVVGFLVEAALSPDDSDSDPERSDVLALGRLLYACLVGAWPGRAEYGLRAAPLDDWGTPLLPRQVKAGVPTSLNQIVDRILNASPEGRLPRLTSARGIAAELSMVLGGADASHDLEQRLKFPVTPLKLREPAPSDATLMSSPLATPGTSGMLAVSAPVPGATPDTAPSPDAASGPSTPVSLERAYDPDTTQFSQPASEEDSTSAMALADFGFQTVEDDPDQNESTQAIRAGAYAEPFTPIPPPAPGASAEPGAAASESDLAPSHRPPTRRLMIVLLGAFGVVLAISLISVLVNSIGRVAPSPSRSEPPYQIVAVRDFDPRVDGGDNRENADLVQRATDGSETTAWTTERYGRSANFNGRKPGTGLLIDLGETRTVRWVRVNFGDGTTTAEVRVPTDDTAATPPMRSRNDWRVVAQVPASTGDVTLRLDRTVETRFVLIYLTELPKRGTYYQGSIAEIQVGP